MDLLALSQLAGQRTGMRTRADESAEKEWDRSLLNLKRGWQEADAKSAFENDLSMMAEETRIKKDFVERQAQIAADVASVKFDQTRTLGEINHGYDTNLANIRETGASDRQQAGFNNSGRLSELNNEFTLNRDRINNANQLNRDGINNANQTDRDSVSNSNAMDRLMEQLNYNQGRDQVADKRYDQDRTARVDQNAATNQARVEQERLQQLGQTSRNSSDNITGLIGDAGGWLGDTVNSVGGWLGDMVDKDDGAGNKEATKTYELWLMVDGKNLDTLRGMLNGTGVSKEVTDNIITGLNQK